MSRNELNDEIRMMAKTVAIVNQKGHAGKSTTAASMALSLSATCRVLLVGLDPLGTSAISLCMSATENGIAVGPDVAGWLQGRVGVDAVVRSAGERLDVIVSSASLIGFEIEGMNLLERESLLRKALAPISDNYDYILIDTPSSLGLLTMNGLTAAESVIIPVRCDYFAPEGMAELFRVIGTVQRRVNTSLAVGGILITHVDEELRSTGINVRDIRTCYGEATFQTMIREGAACELDYRNFVDEWLARNEYN